MQPQVNPNMIVLARESRGYTQLALANELRIPQALLSRIEHGIKTELPEIMMNSISERLKFPKCFFYQPGNIMPLSTQPQYRKRVSLKAIDQRRIEAEANIIRTHAKKLLQDFEIETKLKFFDLDEYQGSPEAVAQALRLFWKIPRGPIQNMVQVLEAAGILIIDIDLRTPLVDGFAVYDGQLPPLIFVNQAVPGDRLRFTLAHELGHITMHNTQSLAMEEEANSFAAEFLMPAFDISTDFEQRLDLRRLADLKQAWKVSMAAVAMRAKNLGRITEGQYQYICVQMSSAGYRRQEPVEIQREEPKLMKSLVDAHLNQLGYTVADLSRLFCLEEDETRSRYLDSIPRLRVLR